MRSGYVPSPSILIKPPPLHSRGCPTSTLLFVGGSCLTQRPSLGRLPSREDHSHASARPRPTTPWPTWSHTPSWVSSRFLRANGVAQVRHRRRQGTFGQPDTGLWIPRLQCAYPLDVAYLDRIDRFDLVNVPVFELVDTHRTKIAIWTHVHAFATRHARCRSVALEEFLDLRIVAMRRWRTATGDNVPDLALVALDPVVRLPHEPPSLRKVWYPAIPHLPPPPPLPPPPIPTI
jgi:hypothetical protein